MRDVSHGEAAGQDCKSVNADWYSRLKHRMGLIHVVLQTSNTTQPRRMKMDDMTIEQELDWILSKIEFYSKHPYSIGVKRQATEWYNKWQQRLKEFLQPQEETQWGPQRDEVFLAADYPELHSKIMMAFSHLYDAIQDFDTPEAVEERRQYIEMLDADHEAEHEALRHARSFDSYYHNF